jgi:hypothetical protein
LTAVTDVGVGSAVLHFSGAVTASDFSASTLRIAGIPSNDPLEQTTETTLTAYNGDDTWPTGLGQIYELTDPPAGLEPPYVGLTS